MKREAATRRRVNAAIKDLLTHQQSFSLRRVFVSPRRRVPSFVSADQYVRQCGPQMPASRRSVIVWLIVATLALLFVSLIVIAPLALAHGHDLTALVIYKSFGRFCHQIPERSFYLDGHPLAVCARCTGIYFGFTAGVLLYPLVRSLKRNDAPARLWLLAALVPTALDFALDFFGIWKNTHFTRSATGALLGAVTAFYVVSGLLDLSRMSFRRSTVGTESIGNEGV